MPECGLASCNLATVNHCDSSGPQVQNAEPTASESRTLGTRTFLRELAKISGLKKVRLRTWRTLLPDDFTLDQKPGSHRPLKSYFCMRVRPCFRLYLCPTDMLRCVYRYWTRDDFAFQSQLMLCQCSAHRLSVL